MTHARVPLFTDSDSALCWTHLWTIVGPDRYSHRCSAVKFRELAGEMRQRQILGDDSAARDRARARQLHRFSGEKIFAKCREDPAYDSQALSHDRRYQ
jgi:hypothetical protein